MARKTITGLQLRGGLWHIDKQIKGYGRLCESTGTSDRKEAEKLLIFRLEGIRQSTVYGVRQDHIWREAATRFLEEYSHQPSIWHSAIYLKQLDPYIGDLPIREVDNESLEAYVEARLNAGRAPRTINIALQRVVRILNLCARKWRDERKRPWLDSVPLIEMVEDRNPRKPYPMGWDEQDVFFTELPSHLRRMALYKVNTGCREQEVCKLRWEWEIPVPSLRTSVFLLPADFGGRFEDSGVKNRQDRLVVLNRVARAVIEGQRGLHPEWVFPYHGTALHRMNDSAWRKARERAAAKWAQIHGRPAHEGFGQLRVHDLKHTFGRRLRAADVPHEDRQVLLGHTNGSVTSHYSAAELGKLIEHADKVAATSEHTPALTVLKRRYA
ncbi:tyrosine-type recombinase/integrase [Achromobacter xylosoxidans]|uniref:tyrosine-type recombinase/integrase n=1 Tax=Alcaligenes xylosoxydans xylosoxydans TaxID=85698 RepID=UPI0022B86A31|nr:tyrosine-type recombinase/integrase [Achromobacter xylosoxidans]MCZ8441770.1 tyrosine-type recombinase/integrase [Achromobacter xylosoxidans]